MAYSYIEIAFVIAVLTTFSIISYKKKSLTIDGVALANVFGILVYSFGGLVSFLSITVFFAIAEASTKYSRAKLKMPHEQRNISNILGNGLPALVAVLLGNIPAFYGAISAALSDTVSSEIGMLSSKKPRLITRPKEFVERGADGGITFLGFVSGTLAGLVMGIIYYLVSGNLLGLVVITTAGIGGSIVDSILGAELERKGIIGNTTVNFLASTFGAIVAFVFLH